jgi:hypothetical protein
MLDLKFLGNSVTMHLPLDQLYKECSKFSSKICTYFCNVEMRYAQSQYKFLTGNRLSGFVHFLGGCSLLMTYILNILTTIKKLQVCSSEQQKS